MSPSAPSILMLNDDVLFEICQTLAIHEKATFTTDGWKSTAIFNPLKTFSLSCKRIRHIAAPVLFRAVRIDGRNDTQWTRVNMMLDSIQQCPFTIRYIRSFTIERFARYDSGENDHSHPSYELARKVAVVLQATQNLETVRFETNSLPDIFKASFEKLNVKLPSVQSLFVNPSHSWLPPLCDNLQTLVSVGGNWRGEEVEKLIRTSAGLTHLRHLHVKVPGHPGFLELIHHTFPNLLSLGMMASQARYETKFPGLLPGLARFADLKTLALDEAFYLGVGFNPPKCGNVYSGPRGHEVKEMVKRQREYANNYVVQAAFSSCPKLEEVWIGQQTRSTVVRKDNGRVDEITMHAEQEKPKFI